MTVKEFKMQLALGSLSYDDKKKLAMSPYTSKGILKILSKDENRSIKYFVVMNINTPKDIIEKYYLQMKIKQALTPDGHAMDPGLLL